MMMDIGSNLTLVDIGVRSMYWKGMTFPLRQIKIMYMADTIHEQEVVRISRLGDDAPNLTLSGRYGLNDIPALIAALQRAAEIAATWAAESDDSEVRP